LLIYFISIFSNNYMLKFVDYSLITSCELPEPIFYAFIAQSMAIFFGPGGLKNFLVGNALIRLWKFKRTEKIVIFWFRAPSPYWELKTLLLLLLGGDERTTGGHWPQRQQNWSYECNYHLRSVFCTNTNIKTFLF